MVQYDLDNSPSGNSAVSQRVVAAVADARDVDPLELPPLYDVIDPDALDQLFAQDARGSEKGPRRVIFVVAGCEVVVHSDGGVDVTVSGERESTASAANPVPNGTRRNSRSIR